MAVLPYIYNAVYQSPHTHVMLGSATEQRLQQLVMRVSVHHLHLHDSSPGQGVTFW